MLNGTIIKRELITPDLMIVKVRPDDGIPDFKPGQYVVLGLAGDAPRAAGLPAELNPQVGEKFVKRAYSIASSPSQKDALEFFIAVVRDGSLTARILALEEQERVHVGTKITGTFTLADAAPTDDLIFISTGTGLAPFISMLRTPGTLSQDRTITVIHGVRYACDLAYVEELRGYAHAYPGRFNYVPIVSRVAADDTSWTGKRGRVQSLFESVNGAPAPVPCDAARSRVYMCGNPAMIEEMEALLAARGMSVHHAKKNPAGRVHVEKYW